MGFYLNNAESFLSEEKGRTLSITKSNTGGHSAEAFFNLLTAELQEGESLFALFVRGHGAFYIAPLLSDQTEWMRFYPQICSAEIMPLRFFAVKHEDAVSEGVPLLAMRTTPTSFDDLHKRFEERKKAREQS